MSTPLAMPPQPFSAVFAPQSASIHMQIPVDMRNDGVGAGHRIIEIPVGVVQVIVTWKGVDPLTIRHYVGNNNTFEAVATIPASSTVGDRSTGVLTLASDKRHGVSITHGLQTTNWNANTLSKGYVAGIQVIPMGTNADITGGGSLLRTDTSVGTRVFLGDTMIYGDTGWRNVPPDMVNLDNFAYPTGNASSYFRWARVGTTVNIEGRVQISESLVGTSRSARIQDLITDAGALGGLPRNRYNSIGIVSWSGHVGELTLNANSRRADVAIGSASGVWSTNSTLSINARFETDASWPTSLPGTTA